MKALKLFVLMFIATLGAFVLFGAITAKVAALPDDALPTDVFPRDGNSMLFVTHYKDGANLETPKSQLRIFYDEDYVASHTNFTVHVDVICRGGSGDPGGGVTLGPNSEDDWNWAGRCNNGAILDTTPNGSAITQTVSRSELKSDASIYGKKYRYYVDLTLRVTTDNAAIGAIVRAPQGRITFQELVDDEPYGNSNNYTGHGTDTKRGPYNFGGSSKYNNAYAILPKSDTATYHFTFATSCQYTGEEPFYTYLRWYDADWGVLQPKSGQGDSDYSFDLVDTSNSNQPVKIVGTNTSLDGYNDNLGGNDAYREVQIKMIPHHIYMWTWHSVYHTNGIQFWIPFSEINATGPCDTNKTPTGNLTLHCDADGNDDWYTASGNDPDHNGQDVSYQLRRAGDTKDSGTTNNGGKADDRHNYNLAAGGTYNLWVKDKDDGQFYKVDTATAGPNCAPTPATPSCYGFKVKPNMRTVDGDSYKEQVLVTIQGTDKDVTNDKINYDDGQQTYRYTALKQNITITIVRRVKVDGSWQNYTDPASGTLHCYQATCQVLSVSGNGEGGLVQASNPFTMRVRVINNNTSPEAIPIPAGVTDQAGVYHQTDLAVGTLDDGGNTTETNLFATGSIDVGDFVDINVGLTAPDAVRNQYYNLVPVFNGIEFLGGLCPGSTDFGPIQVHKHFTITPQTDIVNTNPENPTAITYYSCGATDGVTVSSGATTTLTQRLAGSTVDNPVKSDFRTHNYGDCNATKDTFTYNPSFAPGDYFCSQVTISPAEGWLGPEGVQYPHSASATSPNCIRVVNEPYIHVFNSDIEAGGGFGNDGICPTTNGGISTYAGTTGPLPTGSGSQLAALSLGPVSGFSSAILRPGGFYPYGSTGLTFANTTANATQMGGSLGGTHCVRKYFPDTLSKTHTGAKSTQNSADLASMPSGQYYIKPSSGSLTINAGGASLIAPGTRLTLYVEGDVVIKNNIVYGYDAGSGTQWSSLEAIPALALIVKGNIYINGNTSSGVGQLDGVYIAQPNASGTGNVYTCANGPAAMPGAAMYNNCRKQLVVNGAMVAQKFYLQRSFGSLRNSSSGERYGSGAKNCTDSGTSFTNDCAAEIFNFSPEIYMAQFNLPPPDGPTSTKYDSIAGMSPVL